MVAKYRMVSKVVYRGYKVIDSVLQVEYSNGKIEIGECETFFLIGFPDQNGHIHTQRAETYFRTDSYPVEIQSVLIVKDQQGNVCSLKPETYHPKVLDSDFDVIHSLEVL